MTSPPTLPSPGKHVPILDGIRGLAIALVLFHHFLGHAEAGGSVADTVVFSAASRGWMGVDLFFVLSGFLITGILFDAKGSEGYFRRFYARRMLRIFPAYYAVMVVFFVVLPAMGSLASSVPDTGDQAWHWAFLSNFKIAAEGQWYPQHIPNVFWSLAIEEQFYLVWPIIVLLCGPRLLMGVCGLFFFTAMLTRLALTSSPDVTWITSFVLTPARMDGLALGSFLAVLARSAVDVRRTRAWAVGIGVSSLIPWMILELQRPEGWRVMPIQSFRFSLIALIFGSLVWLCVTRSPRLPSSGTARSDRRDWLAVLFGSNVMRCLGKYSYALYLWHGPMAEVTLGYYNPGDYGEVFGSRLPHTILFCAIAGGLSMSVAWLSWHVLEKHFLKLKRFFPASRTESDPVEPDALVGSRLWAASKRRLSGPRTSDRHIGG